MSSISNPLPSPTSFVSKISVDGDDQSLKADVPILRAASRTAQSALVARLSLDLRTSLKYCDSANRLSWAACRRDMPALSETWDRASVLRSEYRGTLRNKFRWRSGSGWNWVGVVSVFNPESSGVRAPERRPR